MKAVAIALALLCLSGCANYTPGISDAEALLIRAAEYPEYLAHKNATKPHASTPATKP